MTKGRSSTELTLREAVELYRKEERAPANAYDWYRKAAQQSGKVYIGKTYISAYKRSGVWYVGGKEFAEAIKRHRESIRHLKQVTVEYSKGIIHGKDGDTIYTEWGGYEIHQNFRFVWSDVQRYRRKSYGTWYCNRCQTPAMTEHNKEECHLCSDWGGCGTDCTLSRVYCPNCGASLDV